MERITAILILCVVGSYGYPNGPPVKTNPGICSNMEPEHGSVGQQSEPPYEIVTPSSCYSGSHRIPVVVRVKPGEEMYKYFEGFFIMARSGTSSSTNVGNFTINDPELQTLDCFGRPASAVGHNQKKHWTCKQFTWWGPPDPIPEAQRQPVYFQATIVKNTETYWLNVRSKPLRYDPLCTYDMNMNGKCEVWEPPMVSGSIGMKAHVVAPTVALIGAFIY